MLVNSSSNVYVWEQNMSGDRRDGNISRKFHHRIIRWIQGEDILVSTEGNGSDPW